MDGAQMNNYLCFTATKPGFNAGQLWYFRDRLEKFIISHGCNSSIFTFASTIVERYENDRELDQQIQYFLLSTDLDISVILGAFSDYFYLDVILSEDLSELTPEYRTIINSMVNPPLYDPRNFFREL